MRRMDCKHGKSFGDFVFNWAKPIGKGGYSTVFAAESSKTGVTVALKVIDTTLLDPKIGEKRVKDEITIHMQLDHRNIVLMDEVFEDGKFVVLVLELCKQDLARFLDGKPCSEEKAKSLFRQLVPGLIYIHECNIIHRDLKPGNILLTEKGEAKIADFGMATRIVGGPEGSPQNTTLCGTPNYMSPESFQGSHGKQVDIWSVGAILYTMLTGKPPCPARGNFYHGGFWESDQFSDYEPPKLCSPAASDLVAKLLEENPSKRIRLENILKHPWFGNSRNCKMSPNMSHSRSFDSGNGSLQSLSSSGSSGRSRQTYLDANAERLLGTIVESSLSNYGGSIASMSGAHRTGQSALKTNGCSPKKRSPVELEKLNTAFLKTQRVLIGKKQVLSILESGEVAVEFLKKDSSGSIVAEVVRISGDGDWTYIYQPNDKRLRSSPAPLPSDLEPFSFSSIPVHYREKYRVASRFVDLCKSKTIKHSIWTNEARCNLMRNEPHPNVETNFGNGLKIIQIVDSVTIKHTNDLLGELVRFHPNDNPPGNSYLHEWRHHVSCRKRILLQNKQTEDNDSLFPDLRVLAIGYGRKPDILGGYIEPRGSRPVNRGISSDSGIRSQSSADLLRHTRQSPVCPRSFSPSSSSSITKFSR